MRRYKRNEPFRFNFDQPLYCCFFIMGTNRSKIYDGTVLDLSPNGIKIKSTANLLIHTKIELSFYLDTILFDVKGEIRWKKAGFDHMIAGIQLENDEFTQKKIIEELKLFVKREQRLNSF